ncbi:MAG: methyltransferase domain-containing protein [Candidatus Methanoperedenaceae archaeon]|nr:methyltransferase domain-containing protein [Candidatus Methanoperedenaceae archaeon]MDW7725923.1 methyltransferase domain-containing protein [Candidatus Methanoperedens sp.]
MDRPIILKTTHEGKTKEYFVMPEGEKHTDLGIIKLDVLKEMQPGDTISSHTGVDFTIQKPRSPDFFRHAKRTGAPMMPKDIGVIISNTGLCSTDSVLDAGTGSGILAIYLGAIAKKVVSYEIREEFVAIAGKNIALAGLSNVEIRHGDIVEEIRKLDNKFDVITLDTMHSAQVVPSVPDVIYPGGFLAVYSPFFEQTKEVRQAIDQTDYTEVKTLETMEREISFSERGTRPSTARVGHTGFITLARY